MPSEMQFIRLAQQFSAETLSWRVLDKDEGRQLKSGRHEWKKKGKAKKGTGSWGALLRGCCGSQVTAGQSFACLKWKSSQTSSLLPSVHPPIPPPPPTPETATNTKLRHLKWQHLRWWKWQHLNISRGAKVKVSANSHPTLVFCPHPSPLHCHPS